MANPEEPLRLSAAASARLLSTLDSMLADPTEPQRSAEASSAELEPAVLELVEGVFRTNRSYRDGLLIQLAFGLEATGTFDHTKMGQGGRGVSKALGAYNEEHHIPAVKDAYQNIGKNSPVLTRGNVAAFDDLLHWMNQAPPSARLALFRLAAAKTALLARPVSPMPALATTKLTFVNVAALMEELFAEGSGGAHEQFAVAAFVEAILEEFGFLGPGQLWVKTKNINASDASSGAAADVQIMRGNRIEEGFEVSANDWRSKVNQALATAVSADLPRIHLIARAGTLTGLASDVANSPADLSVIDLAAFLRTLMAVLRKPGREVALSRLYQLLARNQPNVERVNRFVELLRSHSLTA